MSEQVDPAQARAVMALLDNPDPAAPIVHRCRCGEQVPTRADLCGDCMRKEIEDLCAAALRKARASLPSMPHAHFGNPVLASMVAPEMYQAARTWSVRDGGLVLLGTTGMGKTTVAVAIARHRLDTAKTAEQVRIAAGIRFMSALDLHRARTEHARAGFSADRVNDDAPAIARAKTTSLLVLDEVGFEPAGRREEIGIVFDIAQARYNAGLPTIVTSGLSEADIAHRYGEATKRRLCERATVVSVFRLSVAGKGAA